MVERSSTRSQPRQRSSHARRYPWRLGFIAVVVMIGGFIFGAGLAWLSANPSTLTRLWARVDVTAVSAPRQQAKLDQIRTVAVPVEPRVSPATDPVAIHPLARFSSVPVIMYHDVVDGRKQIWFDTTVTELREHFERIRDQKATVITSDQLYNHLSQGSPLPEKPILLTFDDAYLGLYANAFPLLKEFNYPATYFVQTGFVGVPTSKDHFTWEQMKEMDQSGLITFAPHTINHPNDLRVLDDVKLEREISGSRRIMEDRLGHPMNYFAYPAGNRDERVVTATRKAGYVMAFTMDTGYAGQSPNLLAVKRYDPFKFREALLGASFNANTQANEYLLNVLTPIELQEQVVDRVRTLSLHGGRVATVHADQRYDVSTLINRYQATAGVNGSFFSIPWINSASNIMVGPVLSAATRQFVPGRPEDIRSIQGRPLVLIGDDDQVRFVPFDPDTMNDLAGIQQLMPKVRDLFVAGLWLVRNGQALSEEELASFRLSSAAEFRPRVYLGVDQENRLTVGVTDPGVNSLMLAQRLPQIGLQEAVLLDSGFSTSLVYENKILATGHASAAQPSRPVPHAILLYDLTQLWAQQDAPASPSQQPLDRLVMGLAPAEAAAVKTRLEAVISGQQTLRRRERGTTIRVIQQALNTIAIAQQQPSPIGTLDGVYGGELARAVGAFQKPPADPSQLYTPTTAPEIDVIDSAILGQVINQLSALPPPYLVNLKVPRPIIDPNRKTL